eukprot:8327793-Pyramimonas_sp.AAC.1
MWDRNVPIFLVLLLFLLLGSMGGGVLQSRAPDPEHQVIAQHDAEVQRLRSRCRGRGCRKKRK